MHASLAIAATFLVASSLSSQTFVVGPLGQFASIDAAVAAVPNGALVLVRAGTYASFTVQGKALTLLADPGVQVPSATVDGTSSTQTVVLDGLQVQGSVALNNCAGPVLLREVSAIAPFSVQSILAQSCSWIFCDRIHMATARFTLCPAVTIVDSSITAGFGEGLIANASSVTAVDCELRGGIGVLPASGNGILMEANSTVRLLGTTTVQAGTSFPPGQTLPCILGPGVVRRGPAATTVGPIANATVIPVPENALLTSPAVTGVPMVSTLRTTSGALAALALGLPGPVTVLPGIDGSLWLDASSLGLAAAVVATGPVSTTVQVPANPLLVGLTFGWQAITFEPNTGFSLSNPAWVTIR